MLTGFSHTCTAYDERVIRELSAPTRHHRPSWTAAFVAFIVLISGLLMASPARADDLSATVTITGVSPSTVPSDGDLTVTGTVTNTGSSRISGATVRLWSTRGPITNGDALHNALDDTEDVSQTVPVRGDDASSVIELSSRTSAPYSLKAATTGAESLGLASTSSAYLIGVMLLAPDGGLIASSSIVVPHPGQDGYQAATIAELSSAPSLVPASSEGTTGSQSSSQAVFTDDHLATEIADGGRLDLIADLAETDDVTSLIDPFLWDELSAMAAGYQVRTGPEATVPGSGQEAAASFLGRLQTIASNGRSYRTLYGSPDVAAAVGAGRTELIGAAADALAEGHPLAGLPLAVTTGGSSTSQAVIDALRQVNPTLVLASDMDADGELYRVGGLTMLATHGSIFSGSGGDTNSDVQRSSRLQSEQLVYSHAGSPAVDLVTSTDAARAELAEATGRHRITVDKLTASQEAVSVAAVTTAPSVQTTRGGSEFSVRGGLGVYEELTGRSSGIDGDRLALAVWSSSFADDESAGSYASTALSPVTSALSSGEVSVHLSERLVIPDDDSSLPVSVTNTMSVPVRVRIHFDSDNPSRISIADTDVLEIGAGESVTVRISPTATSNGDVQMSAVVMTTGERSTAIGPRTEFVVSANSSGRVAWVIIIASGIVLMAATALRIKQVRHERTHAGASGPSPDRSPDRRADGSAG